MTSVSGEKKYIVHCSIILQFYYLSFPSTGHVTWSLLLGLLPWYPLILSCHCTSFEDQGTRSLTELQWLDLTDRAPQWWSQYWLPGWYVPLKCKDFDLGVKRFWPWGHWASALLPLMYSLADQWEVPSSSVCFTCFKESMCSSQPTPNTFLENTAQGMQDHIRSTPYEAAWAGARREE